MDQEQPGDELSRDATVLPKLPPSTSHGAAIYAVWSINAVWSVSTVDASCSFSTSWATSTSACNDRPMQHAANVYRDHNINFFYKHYDHYNSGCFHHSHNYDHGLCELPCFCYV